MRLTCVLCLLIAGTGIGCNSKKGNPENRLVAKEGTEKQTPESIVNTDETETANTDRKAVPKPVLPVTEKRNLPSSPSGDAVENDQATESSEQKEEQEPKKASEQEEPPETGPISWLQRVRFWDMANRIIARRDKERVEFNDSETEEFACALEEIKDFHERVFELQKYYLDRLSFATSDYFKKQMLAFLRGEVSLPEGTRDRYKKLWSLNLNQVQPKNYLVAEIELPFIHDEIFKGSLFKLSLQLRERLRQFTALREHEIVLDEFFLSFPLKTVSESDLNSIWRCYPNVAGSTPRELWTAKAPEWFRKEQPNLHKVHSDQETSFGYSPSFIENSEIRKLIALADRLEELSGGAEPLLKFPEIRKLQPRDRLVEACRRNLAAIRQADAVALREFRSVLHDRLSEEDKKLLTESKRSRSQEFVIKNLGYEPSDFDVVFAIDQAIEGKFELKLFYASRMPDQYSREFSKLVEEKRREVFDTGEKWYFGKSE